MNAVLLLGATSPIARALGQVYAADNRPVFVAARDEDEARRIANDLAIRHGVPTGYTSFDAADLESHRDFVDRAWNEIGGIEIAVLAFGAMGDQERAQREPEHARQIIDVNYTGAVSLCELLAAKMENVAADSARQPTIIGLSSVAGDRGRSSNYIYGSAKGALTLYLQGLRNRLFNVGVRVVTVKLGFIDTRMTFDLETKIPRADPMTTARAIAGAAKIGLDSFYYPPMWAGIMGIIKALPEKVFKRLSL